MNDYVERHLTEDYSKESINVTACCLFALTVKSCSAPGKLGFAPTSARDLINRRHRRLMPQL
jgi:hypothetical protein